MNPDKPPKPGEINGVDCKCSIPFVHSVTCRTKIPCSLSANVLLKLISTSEKDITVIKTVKLPNQSEQEEQELDKCFVFKDRVCFLKLSDGSSHYEEVKYEQHK